MASVVNEEENLYEVLGLDGSQELPSSADIRKAYRRRALECHPDKRPGDKAAAAEFDRVQKAYEILSDEAARKAYDALLAVQRQRAARLQAIGGKRQRMVAELAEREKRAAERDRQEESSRRERDEDVARGRLKAEVERVRREARERERQREEAKKRQAAAAEAGGVSEEELRRTVKVSWGRGKGKRERGPAAAAAVGDGEGNASRRQSTNGSASLAPDGGYSAGMLRSIFETFGGVEDVVVREGAGAGAGAGTGKGSALVVMSSAQAAMAACQAASAAASVDGGTLGGSGNALGFPHCPLSVVMAVPPKPSSTIWGHEPSPVSHTHTHTAGRQGQGGVEAGEKGAERGEGGVRVGGFAAGASKPKAQGGEKQEQGAQAQAQCPPQRQESEGSKAKSGVTTGAGYRDFESVVLMRMRQAAERAKIIAEMKAADEAEAHSAAGDAGLERQEV